MYIALLAVASLYCNFGHIGLSIEQFISYRLVAITRLGVELP